MPESLRRISLASLAFLATTATVAAQIPIGPEKRVGNYPAGWPVTTGPSRVTSQAPDGGFVVAWPAWLVPSGGYNVAAQRYNAAGIGVGPEILVNSYTTGRQDNPSITSDFAGNFIVVWTSDGQDGSGAGVFGQRFDASGARLGAEFRANETTLGAQRSPSVSTWGGGFVVAWTSAPEYEVFARRYDAAGSPVGGEFQVNTYTTGSASAPSVAFEGTGDFVVVWESFYASQSRIRGQRFEVGGLPLGAEFLVDAGASAVTRPRVGRGSFGSFVVAWSLSGLGDAVDIFARRFAPNGAPVGGEFRVNVFTTGRQRNPDVAVDPDGDFVIVWDSEAQDGNATGTFGRRFASTGAAGPAFRVNTYTTGDQWYPAVAIDRAGNFMVTWHTWLNGGIAGQRYAGGLMGMELSVDASPGPASDGNGVFEAGETVAVAPSWLNAGFGAQTFSGTASTFTGPGTPGDPAYTITDATATYGTVASGSTASCTASADCYELGITAPSTRPAPHWDATFHEPLVPGSLLVEKLWTLHVGDSFPDVPRSNGFYRFVETLLHHGVTGGCAPTTYCPTPPATREQMAVFVLVAKEGNGFVPQACLAQLYNDVPINSPFCRWIQELTWRGVVGGCGGGNYCPTASVSRQEMAVFVLATKEPGFAPVACGVPVFNDVPASSPFCRWIEELARRGVVTGCGGGNYCPTASVTREQMAVFLSVTFGLSLYGP